MKRVTLKNKLIAGSLLMVLLVMVASAIAVSVVIHKQTRSASFQTIEKSLNLIRNELSQMQAKLLSDARQMARRRFNGFGAEIRHGFQGQYRHDNAPGAKNRIQHRPDRCNQRAVEKRDLQ